MEQHERVAITGCNPSRVTPEEITCPTCSRIMTCMGGCFGWYEYVCYGDCDARMMENDKRGQDSVH